MTHLSKDNDITIDFEDNIFDIDSGERMAETIYNGLRFLSQNIAGEDTDEDIENA